MFTSTGIFFDHKNHSIELTKKFNKASCRFGTDEYEALQRARKDYPNYRVVVKSTKSSGVDHYNGLTYEFMERYINAHENAEKNLAAFYDLRGLSDEAVAFGAESLSYGEIRKWFFKTFPEIEAFQKRRDEAVAA